MKLITAMIIPLLLAGCGGITRAEWEEGHPYAKKVAEFKQQDGSVIVCLHDHNPQIDPDTGRYSCPSGIWVGHFSSASPDALLVKRYWQDDVRMLK